MPAAPPRQGPPEPPADRRSFLLFGLLALAVVVGVAAYAYFSTSRPHEAAPVLDDAGNTARLTAVRSQPHLLFRNTALGPAYGRVAAVPLDATASARAITPLSCDRVAATRESGFCLHASRGALTTYQAFGFDAGFQVRHTLGLGGAPSRTRTSPDGRLAASTVFVSGDSYNTGAFSTRTTIVDLQSGAALGDLEQFQVERAGQPFKAADFNFWGVTFTREPDRFYATLQSGGVIYLLEGSLSRRLLRIVREGVECPAISPDNTRLVFKSRAIEQGRRVWRLTIVDLAAGSEIAIAESRSVDDQAEWLDNDRVLYGLPRDNGASDIWVARADGTGEPQVFVADGSSPVVIR